MSAPCPHCGRTLQQRRPDGRCAGCGNILPPDMRAPPPPPAPPAGGGFQSNGFRFQIVDDAQGISSFRKELTEYELDKVLDQSGKLPNLAGAPVASWVLARLALLCSENLSFPLNDRQRNDGGGYAIRFLVYFADEQPIAEFQLQGDTMGAAILGYHSEERSSTDIIQAITSALLADPDNLTRCRLSVIDPEWREDPEMYSPRPRRGARNWYGWDGVKFFGDNNIKELATTTAE